jgi:hypothetical protein
MVLSIEEHVFLAEYVFRKGNRYTDFVREQCAEKFPETPVPHRDRPHMLNELKTAVTVFIRNISQADLQKVFANKIKQVQACIEAHGHHFQHLLQVHSDFLNALYYARFNITMRPQ